MIQFHLEGDKRAPQYTLGALEAIVIRRVDLHQQILDRVARWSYEDIAL